MFFDLDGTLLDTAPDMAGAINALRTEQSLDPLPYATVREQVSHGAAAVVRGAFPHAPEAHFHALRDRFLALYRRRLTDETRPFPGILQLLDALERARVAWGVVTNKPAWLTEPLLEALGLRHRAVTVVSGDTLPERKPHPRPLLVAAERAQAAPHDCIYVGDAERDVVAGRAAGMRTLVACFGYIGRMEDARAWPADGWIDSPLDVLPWI
ncbi:MAG: HAD-IA family hydrolase [Gammaproteobacteria bacterium]